MPIDLEDTCASFLAHWKSVRGAALVPTVAAFLDNVSPTHAPWLFMAELHGNDLIVRLEGTGLVGRWGRDLPGAKLLKDKHPDYVRQVADISRAVLKHPCGYYALTHYLPGRGKNVRVRFLSLP